jgi:hypothetical protein
MFAQQYHPKMPFLELTFSHGMQEKHLHIQEYTHFIKHKETKAKHIATLETALLYRKHEVPTSDNGTPKKKDMNMVGRRK